MLGQWAVSASCPQPGGWCVTEMSRQVNWIGLWNGFITTCKGVDLILQVGDTSTSLLALVAGG